MLCRGQNGGLMWGKVVKSGSDNVVLFVCYLCGGIIPHPKSVTHSRFLCALL